MYYKQIYVINGCVLYFTPLHLRCAKATTFLNQNANEVDILNEKKCIFFIEFRHTLVYGKNNVWYNIFTKCRKILLMICLLQTIT